MVWFTFVHDFYHHYQIIVNRVVHEMCRCTVLAILHTSIIFPMYSTLAVICEEGDNLN